MGYAPLEVHHINVGQGDSTLIINRDLDATKAKIEKFLKIQPQPPALKLPDDQLDWMPFAIAHKVPLEGTVKYAVLIDGGEDKYGSDVAAYMEQYGVSGNEMRRKFYMVATHYHSDHIDGLRYIFWVKNIADDTLDVRFPPSVVYDCGDDNVMDPKTRSFENYKNDLAHFSSDNKAYTTRKIAEPGKTTIDLGSDESNRKISMSCLAANGLVYNKKTGTSSNAIVRKKKDQNDRSVVFVLSYGKFKYFLGGDIGGTGTDFGGNDTAKEQIDNRNRKFYSCHSDIESRLIDAMEKGKSHICGFKANHHGSSSSNDVNFLALMTPAIGAVSSGTKRVYHGHPTQQFLNRIDNQGKGKWSGPKANTIGQYFITEVSKNPNRDIFAGKIIGDIIVRPYDIADGDPVKMQVYGTGIQTQLEAGDMLLRNTETCLPSDYYPKGPWVFSCTSLHP
jgi:hypothetical protein